MSYHELRVARIVEETHDTRSFVLEIPPELTDRFGYRAGQYLTFEVPLGAERIVRCYSLASSPDVGDAPKVTVKRVAGGRGSNWLARGRCSRFRFPRRLGRIDATAGCADRPSGSEAGI